VSLRASSDDNGLTVEVRLGFDTSMLNVSWLVRRLASVGMLREYYQC
jgi:hypothetical protein